MDNYCIHKIISWLSYYIKVYNKITNKKQSLVINII